MAAFAEGRRFSELCLPKTPYLLQRLRFPGSVLRLETIEIPNRLLRLARGREDAALVVPERPARALTYSVDRREPSSGFMQGD